MINRPSIEELEKRIGMRFIVVIAAAKRTRDIFAGSTVYYKGKETNPLTMATQELYSGLLEVRKKLDEEPAGQ
ncbi:MAG: DNA-directed RNA polymerase subunit omega [Clostridia bacterium]